MSTTAKKSGIVPSSSSSSAAVVPSGSSAAKGSGAAVATSTGTAGATKSSDVVYQHHEDHLERTWRLMVNYFISAVSKAEKAAADPSKPNMIELDEYVVTFLRTRIEWGRSISYLEAKLEGKAKEMDTLQHYARSQPTLGLRGSKRKREDDTLPNTQS